VLVVNGIVVILSVLSFAFLVPGVPLFVILTSLTVAGFTRSLQFTALNTLAFADVPLPLPAAPEWLSPLSAIIPGQLFAYHLALSKHLDPDHPRSIRKVTRTR